MLPHLAALRSDGSLPGAHGRYRFAVHRPSSDEEGYGLILRRPPSTDR
ncbi:hypothetical protein J7M22_04350 [Candidatus Poribacteria bacterium]|nr:hypothetical protein [Candidatus Poribacteria bacterium]